MVQFHLLHSHHTTNGQKKRKMVERERVLAAATDLREHQIEEQRRQDQLLLRKIRIQKMSEAIRLQNQKAVRMRAVHSAGLDTRRVNSSRRSESAPTLPERKPPVPRLNDLYDTTVDDDKMNAPTRHHTVKRKPPSTTPRSSKKKRQGETQPLEIDAATRAREERRAIAREYMQLQKHSRRIWSVKAKEQSQREQAKRQQQLEVRHGSFFIEVCLITMTATG
ncbi:hypothetical protein PHPALM_30663 [Phytophthora palmivora]|uniref:Uncharacterized protein n=1 Tax=Phytophthora palmivora TaxID=4796 RepID=A0A2P4X4L5_9STRA|nr:hypothetical protein PHPALM_30663 [Phytophthora palmivora]